jgi:hypothetical protein
MGKYELIDISFPYNGWAYAVVDGMVTQEEPVGVILSPSYMWQCEQNTRHLADKVLVTSAQDWGVFHHPGRILENFTGWCDG